MSTIQGTVSPELIGSENFTDASAAVDKLREIYERNIRFLRDHLEAYSRGEPLNSRVRATYPFVRIIISTHSRLDSRLSYGFVSEPGVYQTTVTRPDLFRSYLIEQIGLIIQNHGVPVESASLTNRFQFTSRIRGASTSRLISTSSIDRYAICSTPRTLL